MSNTHKLKDHFASERQTNTLSIEQKYKTFMTRKEVVSATSRDYSMNAFESMNNQQSTQCQKISYFKESNCNSNESNAQTLPNLEAIDDTLSDITIYQEDNTELYPITQASPNKM